MGTRVNRKISRPEQAAQPQRETTETAHFSEDLSTRSPEELRQMIRQLKVRQIALEKENAQLTLKHGGLERWDSEKRFCSLLQSIPSVAVQGYGPDGTTQYWNQASERLYGYRAREAIGRSLLDLIIPPEMQAEVTAAIAQMAETGEPIPASELSLMRKDGSRVPVFSSHAIVQTPGCPPELFCVDIDLTEIKRIEADLRASEKRYRTLYAGSQDAIMILTPDHKFIAGNPTTIKMFGCRDEQDFTSRTATSLSPEYQPDGMTSLNKADEMMGIALGKGAHFFEWMHRRVDGTAFPATVLLSRIENDGHTLLQATVRDITARKRAEEAQQELSSRLLISQEEEQRRIAMELHDQTGQDLMVLKLYLVTLQKRLRKDQPEIEKELDKILHFTDVIVEDIRRLVHGLNPNQLEELGLCDAVKALFQHFSKKTGIPIRFDVDALKAVLHPEKKIILYRIFQETLTNTYKHAQAETVQINVCRQNDSLAIEIKDDGRGFDPCRYHMDKPADDRGMGLSALALRARMIGARLQLFSQPGHGTRINLLMPINTDGKPCIKTDGAFLSNNQARVHTNMKKP